MLKTFLVEDEVVIREMIKKMIPWEQYGFELAGEASDGEMALPLILKSKPDLLITDIKMPFMDGLTLCKLVKKELPNIKIVILSGYDDFNYAKQAISIGVEDYLLKPITKNAFIERLEEIHNRYEHEKTQMVMRSFAWRCRSMSAMQAGISLKLWCGRIRIWRRFIRGRIV